MKKIIFGIFAHPDDEAFGPCGMLLKEVRNGAELHLILLTDGGAGMNPDNLEDLGETRLEEWRKAGALLEATTMDYLGFKDGQLNNTAMIEAGDKIIACVSNVLLTTPEDAVVEFVTLDLNGITGHIDHIVAARAASFAFYRLKQHDLRFDSIRYTCLPRSLVTAPNTSWIFMEAGRNKSEIDEVIDARNLKDDILTIMRMHRTQRSDFEQFLASQGESIGLNYFVVRR